MCVVTSPLGVANVLSGTVALDSPVPGAKLIQFSSSLMPGNQSWNSVEVFCRRCARRLTKEVNINSGRFRIDGGKCWFIECLIIIEATR